MYEETIKTLCGNYKTIRETLKKEKITTSFFKWTRTEGYRATFRKDGFYKWFYALRDLNLALENGLINIKNIELDSLQKCCGITTFSDLDELEIKSKECLVLLKKYETRTDIQTLSKKEKYNEEFPIIEEDIEWYFYYLSIHLKEGNLNKPKIIRTTLQMFTDQNVKVYNGDNLHREDYSGEWHVLHRSNVFSCNLKNIYGSRELHLKFEWPERERGLVVGVYNSYDKHRIHSGSFVMIKKKSITEISSDDIKDIEKRKLLLKPVILNAKSQKEEWEKIPSEIIKYLSIKRLNYYRVPSNIQSLENLNDFSKNYNPFKNRKDFFFDSEKPKIFISFPQTSDPSNSYTKKQIKIRNNIDLIKSELKFDADIVFRQFDKFESDPEVDIKGLIDFQRTKYFVLILTSVQYVSFSILELGQAISYCKNILVMYDKNLVSRRFHASIKDLGVTVHDNIDILTPFETLRDKIVKFINNN